MREFEDQNPLKHLGRKPAIAIFEGKNRQANGEKFPEFSTPALPKKGMLLNAIVYVAKRKAPK